MAEVGLHYPREDIGRVPRGGDKARLATWLAMAGCALAAMVLQAPHAALPDIGWLSFMAERMWAGARLYVDIVEVNPPMGVLLYLPAVLVERVTGSGLVAAMLAVVIAFGTCSILLAARLLRRAGLAMPGVRWPLAAGIVLMVLPLGTFGQREHFALMGLLPYLAAVACRCAGTQLSPAEAALAGLCGAFAMTIKPHFVLTGLLPVIYAAMWTSSVRALFTPENVVAAVMAAAYGLLIVLQFPEYLEVWVPVLRDTYRADRLGFAEQLLHPGFLAIIAMAAGLGLALRRRMLEPGPAVVGLAGLGFLLAALEQGKMWNNHLYPALAAFTLIVLTYGMEPLVAPGSLRRRALPAIGAVAALAAIAPTWSVLAHRGATTVALAPTIQKLKPHEPRLLAFSGAVAAANPLLAEVDGVWTGPVNGQWRYQISDHLLRTADLSAVEESRLESYKRSDREDAAAGLASRPDFILIDRTSFDWHAWALADPRMAAGLADYRSVDEAAGVELWARADLLPERRVGDARRPVF